MSREIVGSNHETYLLQHF